MDHILTTTRRKKNTASFSIVLLFLSIRIHRYLNSMVSSTIDSLNYEGNGKSLYYNNTTFIFWDSSINQHFKEL